VRNARPGPLAVQPPRHGTMDPELAQAGGELGAWVEADIDPARFDISEDGVDVDVRLADLAGRAITTGRLPGASLATDVLGHFGAAPGDVILGTVNAGHPGGMLPLTRDCAASFHDDRLPDNVYVADANLFPEALGNPPILTIVAMAKRIGRLLVGEVRTARLMRAVVQSQRR
jgi:choline dehydrogenase-like flavoprotein